MFVLFDTSARIFLYFKIVILCLPSWSTYSLSDLVTLLCTNHILNWFLLRMVDQEIVPSFSWNLSAILFIMAVVVPYSAGSNSHRSWIKDCIYLFYRYMALHGNRNITAAGTCQGRSAMCLGCLTWNPPLCMCSPSRQNRLDPAPDSTCLTPQLRYCGLVWPHLKGESHATSGEAVYLNWSDPLVLATETDFFLPS